MIYSKTFIIGFAKFTQEENIHPDDNAFYNELFDRYLDEQKKPEPEPGICEQVLEAAAEMTNVSMDELSSGKKYGDIPTCKQITSKILHELKCSDETIASKLPQMGSAGSIKSRREAAAKYQKTEKNYRQVLNQLRERFGIAIPVILRH